MNTKRIALLATFAAAGLALSACGGDKKEEAPAAPEMTNLEEAAPAENFSEVPQEAAPAPRIDNSAISEVAPPAEPLPSDEQTLDDAEATGMTARVSRGDGNETGEPTN